MMCGQVWHSFSEIKRKIEKDFFSKIKRVNDWMCVRKIVSLKIDIDGEEEECEPLPISLRFHFIILASVFSVLAFISQNNVKIIVAWIDLACKEDLSD